MKEGPWWFVPLTAFVGVLLAQSVTLILAWWQSQRHDRQRWHERRIDEYLDFDRAIRALGDVVQQSGLFDQSPGEVVVDWRPVGVAIRAVQDEFFRIEILASPKVVTAAREVVEAAQLMTTIEKETPQLDANAKIVRIAAAKKKMNKAVRAELDIDKPRKTYEVSADSLWGLIAQTVKVVSWNGIIGSARINRMLKRERSGTAPSPSGPGDQGQTPPKSDSESDGTSDGSKHDGESGSPEGDRQ